MCLCVCVSVCVLCVFCVCVCACVFSIIKRVVGSVVHVIVLSHHVVERRLCKIVQCCWMKLVFSLCRFWTTGQIELILICQQLLTVNIVSEFAFIVVTVY